MKKLFFLIVSIALFSSTINAQSISILDEFRTLAYPQVDPNSNHSDAFSRQGDLRALLDHTFDSLTDLSVIKGFNASIRFPDGSFWNRANGLATEFPFSVPMTTSHLMGMGSISKTFVSATVLLLVEDGLLRLDDSLKQYLPVYPNISGDITIRQLLSHTSGLNDFLNENPNSTTAWANNLDSIWTIDAILNNFVLAPNFQAGTSWSYSNTNFLLAGKIIEVLTGQQWYEVVRAKIIDPLELNSTFVYPWESDDLQSIAHAFTDIDGNGTQDDLQGYGYNLEGLFSMANSAGCLISTPKDIAVFMEKLFTGQLLSDSMLAEMQRDYIQGPPSAGIYGLGASSFPFGLANWGHNGSLIYQSLGLYLPDLGLSVALQQNDPRISGAGQQFIDIYAVFVALIQAYQNYEPTSSTAELSVNDAFYVFPNPTEGQLNISFDQNTTTDPIEYQIVNNVGQLIIKGVISDSDRTIRMGNSPDGIYFLKVGNVTHKIVLDTNR